MNDGFNHVTRLSDLYDMAAMESDGRTNVEPEALAGPMAEFGAEVRRWLETVEGLTEAQRAAVRARLAEDELIGEDLLGWTARSLPRLLRGTGAAEVAPLLLAARDEYGSVACNGPVIPSSAAAAARPGTRTCPICMEEYGDVATVPRLLVTCGHTFCEGCLDRMLAPVRMRNGGKRLECPACRVQRGLAASLPKTFMALD